MNQTAAQTAPQRRRGQSLVEVALFLPIFIVILAGLVEVSQLVITQNKVSQAARVSSRFGANGGQNEGMRIVALNTVTQTLLMNPDHWDMWVVRGTVNNDGNAFADWEFTHVYGISNTVRFNDVNEANIQAEVLAELRRTVSPATVANYRAMVGGLRIVGLYTLHDVESILGLDAMSWLQGMYSIRGFSYMRQTGDTVVQTNGCSAFPIAVYEAIRSVNPPGSGGNPYPGASEFQNPNPPTYNSFIYHRPDIPLSEAREGDVFRIWNGFGSGNFGWLLWNTGEQGSATTLDESVSWPGNSTDYTNAGNCGGGSCVTPLFPHRVRGYVNPDNTSDITLHIGDWVPANTGVSNSSSLRTTLSEHISLNRTMRMIVWGESRQQGNNGAYRISGFAVFRLKGYSLQHDWILAEFVRWDTSCGQAAP